MELISVVYIEYGGGSNIYTYPADKKGIVDSSQKFYEYIDESGWDYTYEDKDKFLNYGFFEDKKSSMFPTFQVSVFYHSLKE